MHTLRVTGIAFALLTVYYARFFLAVRQEASTLVQIAILLAAAGVLISPWSRRSVPADMRAVRGWQPANGQGWLTALAGVLLAAAVFAWADHDAHSVSDTLNRAIPTMCLIAAIVLRMTYPAGRTVWKR